MDPNRLFDPAFIQKVKRLTFITHKMLGGLMTGEHRGHRLGGAMEFEEYREYAPGDDVRSIDWNLYQRLDQLLVKLYRADPNLRLTILLDCSGSMAFGEIDKFAYARQVAAALALIGLSEMDRVALIPFADRLLAPLGPLGGAGGVDRLLTALAEQPAHGETNLRQVAQDYTHRFRHRSLIILISDLYDQDGARAALKQLGSRRNSLYVIQVRDRTELEPAISGAVRLVDRETGRARSVTVGKRLQERYRRAMGDHQRQLQSFCRGHRIGYSLAQTDVPFDRLVLQILRQGGLVK